LTSGGQGRALIEGGASLRPRVSSKPVTWRDWIATALVMPMLLGVCVLALFRGWR
jgi:hypothetical protein